MSASTTATPTGKKNKWRSRLGMLIAAFAVWVLYNVYIHNRAPVTHWVTSEQDAQGHGIRDIRDRVDVAYRETAQQVAKQINGPDDLLKASSLIKANMEAATEARNNALNALNSLNDLQSGNTAGIPVAAADLQKVYVYPAPDSPVALPQLASPPGQVVEEGTGTYRITFPANLETDSGIQVKQGQTISIVEMSGLVHMAPGAKFYIGPIVSPSTREQRLEPEDYKVQGRIGSPLLYIGDTVIDLDTARSITAPKDGTLVFGINSRKKWQRDPTGGFTIRFTIQ